MTAIVGVYCKDGVVIGSDSSATFTAGQYGTIEQPTKKIDILGNVIVAGTGQIGLGQRFCAVVKKAWDEKKFQNSEIEVAKYLCSNGIKDFASTEAKRGEYGALVAFPIMSQFHLCEFSIVDFQPEMKNDRLWYVSMGSSQPITDPFLAFIRQVYWNEGLPTVNEAMFAVTWTLDHAISINPGGVNGPIQMAVLEKMKKDKLEARFVETSELDEHRQYIAAGIDLLKKFKFNHQTGAPNIPEIPKPQ
jgi:20S proteasome alpha/beta subunit